MNVGEIAATSVVLLLIMDPLGNMPVFHGLLSHLTPRRRVAVMVRELLIALFILTVFLVFGAAILRFLGLTQSSLNITGGVLLFIISMKMIFHPHTLFNSGDDEPFIVPLAMPIIAGPSTIAVLLLLGSSQPDKMAQWGVSLAVAWAMTTCVLLLSPFVMARLGSKISSAITRLMGMVLVMLATQMLLNGVRDFVASL